MSNSTFAWTAPLPVITADRYNQRTTRPNELTTGSVERSKDITYSGGVAAKRVVGGASNHTPMPMFTDQMKRFLAPAGEPLQWNYLTNPYGWVGGNSPPLAMACPDNSCTAIWTPNTEEYSSVTCAQGVGELSCKNGFVLYSGNWDNGFRHGQGRSTLVDATFGLSTYTGEWKWGSRCGWGKIEIADGTTYEGEWRDDQLNGIVRVTSPDGGVFTGGFSNNARSGVGRYVWPTGAVEDQSFGPMPSRLTYGSASTCAAAAPPAFPYLLKWDALKAQAPAEVAAAPASASSSSSSGSAGPPDAAVADLVGPLKLADKILQREVDSNLLPGVAETLSATLGKKIELAFDWEGLTAAGEAAKPRAVVYTIAFEKSKYVLQPLVAAIQSLCDDSLNKEGMADKTTKVVLAHSTGLVQPNVSYKDSILTIEAPFDLGRNSQFNIPKLAKEIETKL